MAFFRKTTSKGKEPQARETPASPKVEPKKQPKPPTSIRPKASTTVSKGITIDGNISGGDFVQIDGILNGDITVSKLNIGVSGSVNGVVKADSIIIDGKVKGRVYAKELEIRKTGQVTDSIYASNLIISGIVIGDIVSDNLIRISKDGTIEANSIEGKRVIINGNIKRGRVIGEDSIEIEHDGKILTERLESRRVVVNGKIEGKITASELLDVGRNGFVQGEITVKNIKTQEGGRVIGTMVTYEEPKRKPEPKQIVNSIEDDEEDIIDTKLA
jgi:cytoskeletal protein CcmA (bactofilin family)